MLNALLFTCLFPFVTYLSIYTVDLTFNIFLLLTVVPNTLQFSFACLYALGTSILPITGDIQGRGGDVEEGFTRKVVKFLRALVPHEPRLAKKLVLPLTEYIEGTTAKVLRANVPRATCSMLRATC